MNNGNDTDQRSIVVGALLLFLLVLAAYGPALHAGFIWDDDMFITDNDTLQSADGLRVIWTEPAKNPHYYPLLMTLFWLMYQAWGVHPAGYHLVTVLCHACCAILFWRMLVAIGARGAFLAAIVFALHPVHVQSVAWCTELKNTLSGIFYVGAILAWAREDRLGRARAYGLCAVLFVAALLSKTTAVSLPLAILLLEFWRHGRVRRPTLVLVLGLVVLALTPALVTLGLERSRNVAYVSSQFLPAEKLIVIGLSVWFYLGKLLWPHPLIMIYPYWQLDMTQWAQYLPLVLLVLSVPILFLSRKFVGRALPLAWVFFIATLSPIPFMDVNFVLQHSFVADHFIYLPSLGLIAVFAAGLSTPFRDRTQAWRVGLGGMLALILAGLTWNQCRHYKDQEALWTHTLKYNPKCAVAFNNLGLMLLQKGHVDEAIEVIRKGITGDSHMPKFHSNLAVALRQKGDELGAASEFETAIKMDPTLYEARLELAELRIRQGNIEAALSDVRGATQARPDKWEPHWNLGALLLAEGKFDEAAASFEKALALREDDRSLSQAFHSLTGRGRDGLEAMQGLVRDSPTMVLRDPQALQPRLLVARALARAGDASSARALLDEVARQASNSAEALYQLGAVALERRDYSIAADNFARALVLEPQSSELMNNLAWVRATAPDDFVRDARAAVILAERAVEATRRSDPALLDTLAASYAEAGRFVEAVKTAEEAIDLARRAGHTQLVQDVESRANFYRKSKPYRDAR